MYSFPNLEPVHCSMSGSNCCFLTYIQVSQEAGQVVWYSHLFQNFLVCCDPHKGFGVVNNAEINVFLELSCFFPMIQQMLAIWSRIPLRFLNPAWISASSWFVEVSLLRNQAPHLESWRTQVYYTSGPRGVNTSSSEPWRKELQSSYRQCMTPDFSGQCWLLIG